MAGRGRLTANGNIAASSTDGALVSAVSNKRIRVIAVGVSCGATPSSVVFNSKGGGAGTAISAILNNSISLPELSSGWFDTNVGEGLTATTGAGSTSGIIVSYEVVS